MNKLFPAVVLFLACAPVTLATPGSAPKPATTKAAVSTTKPAATGQKGNSTAATKAAQPKVKKLTAAEAAVIEKFVNLQDAAIATFLELGDTLEGVTDKESADAAAPTVKMAGEQLYTITAAVEALGNPSEGAQQAIMSRMANVAEKQRIEEAVMEPMLTLMMQEPPCYGSEALYVALDGLLANLQGAAGLDDEEVDAHADAAILQEPDSDEAGMQQ